MTQFSDVPRRPLSNHHHRLGWLGRMLLNTVLVCTVTIPNILPAHASDSQTESLSGCRAYLTAASTWQGASQRSLGSAYRAIALQYASDAWLRTAMTCSTLRAQSIIYSAIDQYNLSHITDDTSILVTTIEPEDSSNFTANRSAITQLLVDHTSNLSLGTSDFPNEVLAAFSHAEDRLRFAYDTIDGLSTAPPQYRSASHSAMSASQSFATLYSAIAAQSTSTHSTQPTQSPRERVYSAQELVSHANSDSTLVDKHTGTTMPLTAAIELDTALQELRAFENSSTLLTSTTITPLNQSSSQSNSKQWLIEVCCLIARHHMLSALEAGATAISELYLQ